MGLNPGRLRHRVSIQHLAEGAADAAGGRPGEWQTLATAWCEVIPLEGREALVGMGLTEKVTHRVTMRYRPSLTADLRLRWGVRTLAIRSVIDIDERHHELQLLCEETK